MAMTQDRRTDRCIYAFTVHDLRMSEIPKWVTFPSEIIAIAPVYLLFYFFSQELRQLQLLLVIKSARNEQSVN